MQQIQLLIPTPELKEEYFDFYQEWKSSGEDIVPWVVEKDPTDFLSMVDWLKDNANGVNIPVGWVPSSTFWLVDDKNRILGAVNLRHRLTDFLRNRGGHIGYGIRPSERQKGYATQLLNMSLNEAKKLGINNVLVVCDAINNASERTIVKNGGILDSDFIEEDGNIIRRYWINT